MQAPIAKLRPAMSEATRHSHPRPPLHRNPEDSKDSEPKSLQNLGTQSSRPWAPATIQPSIDFEYAPKCMPVVKDWPATVALLEGLLPHTDYVPEHTWDVLPRPSYPTPFWGYPTLLGTPKRGAGYRGSWLESANTKVKLWHCWRSCCGADLRFRWGGAGEGGGRPFVWAGCLSLFTLDACLSRESTRLASEQKD